MDLKTLAQAGAAVVVAFLFLRFLKWLIPYQTTQSMSVVIEVVQDFKAIMANHMEHQAKEHAAFMEAEMEQIEMLRNINGNSEIAKGGKKKGETG